MDRRRFLATGAAAPLAAAATTHASAPDRTPRKASRLLVAYMPYKFIAHRIQLDLAQPWVLGLRRPLFATRLRACLDIDAAASRG